MITPSPHERLSLPAGRDFRDEVLRMPLHPHSLSLLRAAVSSPVFGTSAGHPGFANSIPIGRRTRRLGSVRSTRRQRRSQLRRLFVRRSNIAAVWCLRTAFMNGSAWMRRRTLWQNQRRAPQWPRAQGIRAKGSPVAWERRVPSAKCSARQQRRQGRSQLSR